MNWATRLAGHNRKTKEGSDHPDRNAQFEHLERQSEVRSLGRRQPVISVDTKKKELVGNFKNGGRELRPKGQPETVRVHDFVDPELGRADRLTGYTDLGHNKRLRVSVGMDHDTAEFAVLKRSVAAGGALWDVPSTRKPLVC